MANHPKVARINVAELLERVENDRELLEELLTLFCNEFPGRVEALREALKREDLTQVINLSHGLKGMLGNLSITAAAASAAEIERIGRTGKSSQLEEAFGAFEREVQGLLPEVQAQIGEAR